MNPLSLKNPRAQEGEKREKGIPGASIARALKKSLKIFEVALKKGSWYILVK
jgi:hypothetical protein